MKTPVLLGIIFFALLSAFPMLGSADMVQGEIASVNADEGTLVVVRSDPQTGAAEAEGIQTHVTDQTAFEGIRSLEDLRVGDEIRADVESDQGVWKVNSLSLDKVKLREPDLSKTVQTGLTKPQS